MAKIVKKRIELQKFQTPFFESTARFPGMVSSWGTGKTLIFILKALWMSRAYKNNKGMIIRKSFKDLRDSTMSDFEDITGLKIPSSQDIVIPGTNSVIMFRHGDQLRGGPIQNVNLGWFGIEQAEEFDNSDVFDQFRGRLRRKLVVDEKWEPNPEYRAYGDWLKSGGRHVGMIIANANGHNWVWRRWVKGVKITEKDSEGNNVQVGSEFQGHLANTFDNEKILAEHAPDFLQDLRNMEFDNRKKYLRFVMNSQDETDIEGSIYGERLDEIERLGRVCDCPIDTSLPVHVVMDPGYHTAIWFFQIHKLVPKFVRCFECVGGGVEGIIEKCEEFQDKYNYRYGEFFAPFDVNNNAHRTTHGDTLLEAFKENGIRINVLDLETRETDGIVRTERFLGQCWFDEKGCEIGVEALHRLRYKKNQTMSTEEHAVFGTKPVDDWEAHLCDSFRYASLAVPKAANFDRVHQQPVHQEPVMQRTAGCF